MPKVSVIMPVYNAEKYIAKTLESILQQSFQNFELIIIDDCGTDSSMEIVSTFRDSRIKILNNPENRGIAFSRNRGISAAKGDYIALMDDDDLAPLHRFQTEIDYLEEKSEIDVVGGKYGLIDENDKVTYLLPSVLENPKYIRAALMFFDPIGNGTAMIRKNFILQNKICYQNNCFGMEDYRFWVDCSLHGNITNIDEVLLYWRQTDNETTRVLKDRKVERAQCFKEIQRYALERNGYLLAEKEFALLADAFAEDYITTIFPARQLEDIYHILWKLIVQAKKGKYTNYVEVRILCRKLFERRMEFSELWCE